ERSRKEWQFLPARTDGLEVRPVQAGIVTIADCVTGREIGRVTGGLTPQKAWVSSGGTYLVLQGEKVELDDSPVEVWDWRAQKRILEFVGDPAQGLAFSPAGGECAIGTSSGDLAFFDLSQGTEQHRVRLEPSPSGFLRTCVYHPDAAQIVTFIEA